MRKHGEKGNLKKIKYMHIGKLSDLFSSSSEEDLEVVDVDKVGRAGQESLQVSSLVLNL